jgi:hypothetical protein
MGHMSLAPKNQFARFLPHRSVQRPESTTTPLRVVFNAAAREKDLISLNEGLLKGPTIQRDLFDMLLSMRTYKVVFSCDIEKMYRMIWVHPEDRHLQSILWRESPREEVLEYQLNTLTYGTTPASFIATKCLEVIARELEKDQPTVAAFIRNNFYMDDFVGGADSVEEAIDLFQILHSSLEKYGFVLRKYTSNSRDFLNFVPEKYRAVNESTEIKNELSHS